MFGLFKKREKNHDDQPTTAFSLDEVALLQEVERWADTAHPLVRQSSAALDADFGTLLHGVRQVLKAMKDPEHKIGQTTRSEVMDVLRRESMDQHGFDPMAMCQTLRKLMQRAIVMLGPDQRARHHAGFGDAQSQERDAMLQTIAELRAQNATLEEVIDHLSHAPHPSVNHPALKGGA